MQTDDYCANTGECEGPEEDIERVQQIWHWATRA